MSLVQAQHAVLVTGGARSGKSQFAEQLVLNISQYPHYIATAEAFDTEMEARIRQHQDRRGSNWKTTHAPLDLEQALTHTDDGNPRLIDCMTIWLNNLMFHEHDYDKTLDSFCAALVTQKSPVIMVTNELGSGVVPEHKLARLFRDRAGEMNQKLAQHCESVYVTISGLPLKLK